MIEAVVKIGGSLIEYPNALRNLCIYLSKLTGKHKFLMTPGGSRFADLIRDFDAKFHLSALSAHMMAILAIDQYGLFLSNFFPTAKTSGDLPEAERLVKKGFPTIFLPSQLMFKRSPLEASWDVTSDSISAYVASLLLTKKLLLIKDVDGIFTGDPETYRQAQLISEIDVEKLKKKRGKLCVDRHLAPILTRSRIECYVVNGIFPERVRKILENRPTVCTRIKL